VWVIGLLLTLQGVRLVTSAGSDLLNLMTGFRSIRASYSWVCVAILVALLIGVGVVAARSLGWI
jgi:hypothetical protein